MSTSVPPRARSALDPLLRAVRDGAYVSMMLPGHTPAGACEAISVFLADELEHSEDAQEQDLLRAILPLFADGVPA